MPDRFLVRAYVAARADSVAEALHHLAALDERMRLTLDALGIPPEQRATVSCRVDRAHDHRTGEPAGYEATTGLRLSLADPVAVAQVTSRLVEEVGDALRVDGLTLTFSDPGPVFAQARAAAVRAARGQAEQMAHAAGGRLGRLVSLVEGAPVEGRPAVTFLAASAHPMSEAPEIQPGETALEVFVTGTWELDSGPP